MNGEQNIDGKALLSWVTWTCFKLRVAQISKQTSPFVKETSPKLPFSTFYRIYYRVFASWKERKGKFSLKLATDLWSSRPSSTSKSTLIFPSSKQNRHLDDRRNSCLTDLRELLLWGCSSGLRWCDHICEIHSFHTDVINDHMWKYNHYRPKKCV